MKLEINKKGPIGQHIKYHLLKHEFYSNDKKFPKNTLGIRVKYYISQLNRIELNLKKSLKIISFYNKKNNILVFIGLSPKWKKYFKSVFRKKNCFFIDIDYKKISKLTFEQLENKLTKTNNKKPFLILNFGENLSCKKMVEDIPIIDFDSVNIFTVALLKSSLRLDLNINSTL